MPLLIIMNKRDDKSKYVIKAFINTCYFIHNLCVYPVNSNKNTGLKLLIHTCQIHQVLSSHENNCSVFESIKILFFKVLVSVFDV